MLDDGSGTGPTDLSQDNYLTAIATNLEAVETEFIQYNRLGGIGSEDEGVNTRTRTRSPANHPHQLSAAIVYPSAQRKCFSERSTLLHQKHTNILSILHESFSFAGKESYSILIRCQDFE